MASFFPPGEKSNVRLIGGGPLRNFIVIGNEGLVTRRALREWPTRRTNDIIVMDQAASSGLQTNSVNE
jgi:activator of HSP90 ATPase